MINDLCFGFIEFGRKVSFSDRKANGIRDPSTKGACGDFDSRGLKCFGMSRSAGAPLAELLDVLDAHRVIPGEMQQRVNQHAAVTG